MPNPVTDVQGAVERLREQVRISDLVLPTVMINELGVGSKGTVSNRERCVRVEDLRAVVGALTTLTAERDALKRRVEELERG